MASAFGLLMCFGVGLAYANFMLAFNFAFSSSDGLLYLFVTFYRSRLALGFLFFSIPSALQMKTRPSIYTTFSPPPKKTILRGSPKSAMSLSVSFKVHFKVCATMAKYMKSASPRH